MSNILQLAVDIFDAFYRFADRFMEIMLLELRELVDLGIGDDKDILDVPLALLNILLDRFGLAEITLFEFTVVNGLVLFVLICIVRFFLGVVKS